MVAVIEALGDFGGEGGFACLRLEVAGGEAGMEDGIPLPGMPLTAISNRLLLGSS